MGSSSKINFVKATDNDWPILLELEKSEIGNTIYAPETDMNKFKKVFSKSVVYKVTVDGKLAGFCAYELKKDEAEITGLLVLKEFRRKGVGELMIKKLVNDLKTADKIKITTSPENIVALRLYLKYGFVIKGWKDNYWQGQPRLILYRIN